MIAIQLTTFGPNGMFEASNESAGTGTLTYSVNGPGRLSVTALQVAAGLQQRDITCKLLDAVHQFAWEHGYRIQFKCPKARAMNDQQIAHERHELSLTEAAAA